MKKVMMLAIAALVLTVSGCHTPAPSCNDNFYAGEQPRIVNENLAKKTKLLCFDAYAVMYSGVSRTPVWSAEHLTAERIKAARELKRKNAFHAEEQIAPADRSELSDYAHSGYDRGHMSPSGDMPTEQAQEQSFSLANMIPQSPNNNQNLWEGVEEATRSLATHDGEVYVVTGPLFEGSSLERLNGRVLIPTSVFKAIYDPARKGAAAYVTPNAPGMEYQTLSIAQLQKRSGIDVFPKLPADIKANKMPLPVPKPHRARHARDMPTEVNPAE